MKLLPCPLCGETEFFDVTYEERGGGTVTAQLTCLGCDEVHTEGPVSEPCSSDEAADEAATRAWNQFVASQQARNRY
jgi:hypothetical protein